MWVCLELMSRFAGDLFLCCWSVLRFNDYSKAVGGAWFLAKKTGKSQKKKKKQGKFVLLSLKLSSRIVSSEFIIFNIRLISDVKASGLVLHLYVGGTPSYKVHLNLSCLIA